MIGETRAGLEGEGRERGGEKDLFLSISSVFFSFVSALVVSFSVSCSFSSFSSFSFFGNPFLSLFLLPFSFSFSFFFRRMAPRTTP